MKNKVFCICLCALLIFFLISCSSQKEKSRVSFSDLEKLSKSSTSRNITKNRPLNISESVLNESKVITDFSQSNTKQASKLLDIISFKYNENDKRLETIYQNFSNFKYVTGEGFGLLYVLYFFNNINVQKMKWDLYNLAQYLEKDSTTLNSKKGMRLFEKMILFKFKNIGYTKKNKVILIPDCFIKNNEFIVLYERLRQYFRYTYFTKNKYRNKNLVCTNALTRIDKDSRLLKKNNLNVYNLDQDN